MADITAPVSASGSLTGVDINKLFDTVNTAANTVNTCVALGQDLGNAFSGAFNPQQQPNAYDPNSRINNQNPYATNPYAQQVNYQPVTYGYGYGNVGNTMYPGNNYQNGMYPGISNPGYGM